MRVLVVTARYPWPPRRGDRLRALQLVDALAEGHEVTLLTPRPRRREPPPPTDLTHRHELYERPNLLDHARGLLDAATSSTAPLQNALFGSRDLSRRLHDLAPRHDVVVLQLARLARHAEDVDGVPLIVDLIDALSLNLFTRAQRDRRWIRPLLRVEARRLAASESELVRRSAATIVVSERDRRHLRDHLRESPGTSREVPGTSRGVSGTRVRETVAVVPISMVPETRRAPPEDSATAPIRPTLAFTGNLGYFPNRDAVELLLSELWPHLRERRPDARLLVAGARPPTALARSIRRRGATLAADPPDLRALLVRADVALAPLRCGSGLPLKILEAWSVGVPVVASPWAAAGVDGDHDVDLLVAESTDEWVDAVGRLLDDPELRHRLAAAGRRRLVDDFSSGVVRNRFEKVLGAAIGGDG